MAALVQIMVWRRRGDKPLSEPMMVSSLTHICVTRPQWVNKNSATYIVRRRYRCSGFTCVNCVLCKMCGLLLSSKTYQNNVKNKEKYLHVRRASYLWTLRSFQMCTNSLFQINKLHVPSTVLLSWFQSYLGALNPLSKAVSGEFYGSGGHSKNNYLQDWTNFHRSRAWQIFLIFNIVKTLVDLFLRKIHTHFLLIAECKCFSVTSHIFYTIQRYLHACNHVEF